MMDEQLKKRAEDLAGRCEKSASVTSSTFLTPAQVYELSSWAPYALDCNVLFRGGGTENERKVAFFLPAWMDEADFSPDGEICALEITTRFGTLGHRDCLGAVLGLGIQREWLGDILIDGQKAYLFCLPSVKQHILLSLDKVGRNGVKVREIPLSEVPQQEKRLREQVFSVKSLRLDAVCAGMFGLSRTAASEAICAGSVTLNYSVCEKSDMPVRSGDILSLRGKGKGIVLDAGGSESRKGRLFVKTGIYI